MLQCFHGGTVVAGLESRDKFEAIRELIHSAPVFNGAETRNLEWFRRWLLAEGPHSK